MTDQSSFSRRHALLGTAAVGATAAIGLAPSVDAKAPLAKTQPAYFYRFPFGKAQFTIVSDGPLPLGKPADTMKGLPEAEISKSLSDNFLSTDSIVLEQNIPILNTGSRVVMFDTGMGFSKAFGPTTGRLVRSMAEAGLRPAQVDDIVISHAHIDHIGGLATARGQRIFPNATVHIAQSDYDFWTDEKKLTDKALGSFVKHARDNLLPYKGRIKWIADAKEVVPGVTAMSVPGHTVGHTIFLIENDGKKIAFTGDVTHHQILLTEKPRTEFAYDSDPKQAVQSRLKVFDMLAKDRIPMLAFHFPWPGYGYLSRTGTDAYRYYATPMTIVPIPPPAPAKKA